MSIVQSRPRRTHVVATRLFIVGISLASLAIANESKRASETTEPTQVSECLTFTQDPVESGVEYSFANSCKKRLACSFEWTLSCGDEAPFKKFHHVAAVPLGPNAKQSVTADVRVCKGQSWEILGAAWSCSP